MIQIRKFKSATDKETRGDLVPVVAADKETNKDDLVPAVVAADKEKIRDNLVIVYQSFAEACRKEEFVSSDVEFQFDTSSGGVASATNSEKYAVKIIRWGDKPVLPFFSSGIPKQLVVSGKDCIVAPQDALSLRIERRVLDSLLLNKVVELIGAPGIGKTNSMILYLIRLLRNMGKKYLPEDPNDSRHYSSEVFLRTSEDYAFRFYLVKEKTGEEVVKVEKAESNIKQLCALFTERSLLAAENNKVLPALLLELDDEEEQKSNPIVFGRVLVTASLRDLDEKFKSLEKSKVPHVRVLMEPLSEGMMIAVVRGLVTHSRYRDTDPFLSQFVDKTNGKEICKEVRKRFFEVGGFMRDLLCDDDTYEGVLAKTEGQATAKDRWTLMRGLTVQNIPKDIKYLAMPVYIDPTVLRLRGNMQFTFRSGFAAKLVCCNVTTLADVEALRSTHLYSKAIELAWMYAALLDDKTFGYTPPASWHKDNMQFFNDPGHSSLDSDKHELKDDKKPVFPLCTRVKFFDKTVWKHESISDLTQGVLHVGRSSSTRLYEFFTVCHNRQTVYAFNTSSRKPDAHPNSIETTLQAVMDGMGMFKGEGRKYKLQLVYVVDDATSLTGTTGWALTKGEEKFKICDLANLSPEHFAFPATDGGDKGEDRVQGLIVRFKPWGDSFLYSYPKILGKEATLNSRIDRMNGPDFDDLVESVLTLTWARPTGKPTLKIQRTSLKEHLNAQSNKSEKDAVYQHLQDKAQEEEEKEARKMKGEM